MELKWLDEELSAFEFSLDKDDEDLIFKANFLAKQYNLDNEEFIDELIAFATEIFSKNHCHIRRINTDLLERFEVQILAKTATKIYETISHGICKNNTTGTAILDETSDEFKANVPDFNAQDETSTQSVLQATSSSYKNRVDSGKIVHNFQGRLISSEMACIDVDVKMKIVNTERYLKEPFAYCCEKSAHIIEVLCDKIETFGEIIRASHPEIGIYQQCNSSTNDQIVILGQIYSDQIKLSNNSIFLQGCDDFYSTVQLDFEKIDQISLFPGKIAVFEGTNPNGLKFLVEKEIVPNFSDMEILDANEAINVKIWTAKGPFSTTNSVDFDPLFDLFEKAKNETPNLLILMGPFIDKNCTDILDYVPPFQEIFENLLYEISEKLQHMRNMQVLIVPDCQKDMTSSSVFPTPPFIIGKNCLNSISQNIHLLPDPVTVRLGKITVSMTSSETIGHLSKNEWQKGEHSDRMTRLIGHLFNQRSFCPVYPSTSSPNIDLVHSERYCTLDRIPHVLLVPCYLQHFVKIVEGCLCINPGKFIRGTNGGNFAKIEVKIPDETGKLTSIAEYADVSIVKI